MPTENNFFKNFGLHVIRDVIIAVLIAAISFNFNSISDLSKSDIEMKGRVNTLEATFNGKINELQANLIDSKVTNLDHLSNLQKRFDDLNNDINKKLDKLGRDQEKLGDKIDNVLQRMPPKI